MHNLVATVLGQVDAFGGANQQTDPVQSLHYLNNARHIFVQKGMHGKLATLIGKIRTVFSDIDETLVLEAAHIVLQLGVGVSARHNKVDALRLQAG